MQIIRPQANTKQRCPVFVNPSHTNSLQNHLPTIDRGKNKQGTVGFPAGWRFGVVSLKGNEVRFWVPMKFLAVVPSNRGLANTCIIALGTLLRDRMAKRFDKYGYTERMATRFREICGQKKFSEAVKFLSAKGLILVDNTYVVGERCRRYKLPPDTMVPVVVQDKKLAESQHHAKTEKRMKLNNTQRWLSKIVVDQTTFHWQAAVCITDGYDQWGDCADIVPQDRDDRMYWDMSIQMLMDKDYRFATDPKTGRFFSNVTNLPKFLRRFLSLDGEPLWEIDIRCCQPLLLASLYTDLACPERLRYIDDVLGEDFYTTLANKAGEAFDNRDEIKVAVFRDVMYDRVRDTPMWRIFNREYPILAAKIAEVKKDDHAALAIQMQKLEATAMINGVAKDCMMMKLPILTIHDAVLCKACDNATVIELIQNHVEFAVGVCPKLRETQVSFKESIAPKMASCC